MEQEAALSNTDQNLDPKLESKVESTIDPKTPRKTFRRMLLGIVGSFMVAICGSVLWRFLNFPLPWLVGSLYGVALARILGLPLTPLPGARQGGQWVIGMNMGLYFTAAVFAELSAHAPLIVGMALLSLIMGIAGSVLILGLRQADLATAFFSSMPGGAAEMANLSDIWNAKVDQVAAAHAIRVMLVVLIVPIALTYSGHHNAEISDTGGVGARPIVWEHFPVMLAASLAGVGLFKLLRIPNAWVLGTLLGIAAMAVNDAPLSGLPPWLSTGGQLLIGISLGSRFSPRLFEQSTGLSRQYLRDEPCLYGRHGYARLSLFRPHATRLP